MDNSIGIIAGSGQFPFLVAQGAKEAGLRVAACGFHDTTDPALAKDVDAFTLLYLSQVGGLIDFFKKNNITRICLAGAINKPKAMQLPALLLKADNKGREFYGKFKDAPKGDDALLRLIASELQSEGFNVVPPNALTTDLHGASGLLGTLCPGPDTVRDIRFGWKIAKAVGALDIGQCVVVRSGMVAAVEGMEGTDACLARGGSLGGPGCTAVKVIKPGQDERLDLPSLGSKTIALLAENGFACLAFEARGTLFFDKEEALALANEKNIAVVAIPEDADAFFDSLEKGEVQGQ